MSDLQDRIKLALTEASKFITKLEDELAKARKETFFSAPEIAALMKQRDAKTRREALQAAHDAVPEHVTGTPIAQAEIKRLMKANEQGGK